MAGWWEEQNTRNALLLTSVGDFAAHFFELMFPTLAVTIAAQARVPFEQVLGWSFLSYLAFGLGALPAGVLADRCSARLLLIVALFGLGVAALAASEAPDARVLSFCLAAMGACATVFRPAGRRLLARTVAGTASGRGITALFGGTAIVLAPLLTATLCARLGWQQTYRAVGYVLCAVAVGAAFLRVDERRTAPLAAPPPQPGRRERLLPFVVLLICGGLGALTYRGATLVLPTYFAARAPGLSFGAATSLAYVFGAAGGCVGWWLAEHRDGSRPYLVCQAVGVPALLLLTALSGFPLLGGAALFAFFSFAAQPIQDRLLARSAPPGWRAAADGAAPALTAGVGALAVWVVQWAGAAGGPSHALLWLAAVGALALAATALRSSLLAEASAVAVASTDLLAERRLR
jgi:predicted MFS family arabinose efflux permease